MINYDRGIVEGVLVIFSNFRHAVFRRGLKIGDSLNEAHSNLRYFLEVILDLWSLFHTWIHEIFYFLILRTYICKRNTACTFIPRFPSGEYFENVYIFIEFKPKRHSI